MASVNTSSPTFYPPNCSPPFPMSSSPESEAYSPPSIHDLSHPERDKILHSHEIESKKSVTLKILKPDFTIQPPSAPRSMRQAVSPPPIRRSDNFSGPSFRRLDDYYTYRPQEGRSDKVITHVTNRKISVDRYKPMSTERQRSVSPEERWRDENTFGIESDVHSNRPGYDSYRPGASSRRASQWGVPDVEETARPPVPKNPTWRKPSSSEQQDMRPPTKTLPNAPSAGKSFLASMTEGDAPATLKMPSIAPSQTSNNRGQTILNPNIPLPTPPQNNPSSPPADVETCMPSIEKELGAENAVDGMHRSLLKAIMSTTSLVSTTSTPSTAGTVGSKSIPKCRGCRKPASSVTPLVPCSKCRKGYHECCGEPSPRDRYNSQRN
jgi:hypothetical protein